MATVPTWAGLELNTREFWLGKKALLPTITSHWIIFNHPFWAFDIPLSNPICAPLALLESKLITIVPDTAIRQHNIFSSCMQSVNVKKISHQAPTMPSWSSWTASVTQQRCNSHSMSKLGELPIKLPTGNISYVFCWNNTSVDAGRMRPFPFDWECFYTSTKLLFTLTCIQSAAVSLFCVLSKTISLWFKVSYIPLNILGAHLQIDEKWFISSFSTIQCLPGTATGQEEGIGPSCLCLSNYFSGGFSLQPYWLLFRLG